MEYVENEWESLNFHTNRVHRIGDVELIDTSIQRVYVEGLPEMKVKFDVSIELQHDVKERDYHYDETDQCYPWICITCEGDSECLLDDWEIKRITGSIDDSF